MNAYAWAAAAVVLLTSASLAQATCMPSAALFCVTNSGDNGGVDPAPGANTGTLRQAIVDANAAGGSPTIDFDIPGSGPHTITLVPSSGRNSLPFIASNLTIDGFSQPGAVSNTNAPDQGGLNAQLMIEIDGGGQIGTGFLVNGALHVTFNGLAMHGFYGDAIDGEQNQTTASLTVTGCYIGTTIDGTADTFGNHGVALRTGAGHAQIGGILPAQRNLLSGNLGGGILISGPAIIEGNLLGTDASGTQIIDPGSNTNWPGIIVPGNHAGLRIGCTGSGCAAPGSPSRNVISGFHEYGIGIWDGFSGSLPYGGLEIKGNYIGTDWTGTQPLPNGDATGGCPTYCGGIQIQGGLAAAPSMIGGFNPREANLIAFNNGPGIVSANNTVAESFDNQGNAIHHNRNTDITFALGGRIPNDPGDVDTGTNNDQNYPVIQSASLSGGNLIVTYLVDSTTANSSYPLRIDFYVDMDEGSGKFLVTDSYPASSAQIARAVSLPLPADAQTPVGIVTTATDANGYGSEFSPSYVFDRIFADRFE